MKNSSHLTELMAEVLAANKFATELPRIFLNRADSIKKYAIGKNSETIALHRLVGLDGIIDDYSQGAYFWNGIPLIKTSLVPKNALIANCSTSISPIAVLDHLNKSGFVNIIGLHELILASEGQLMWPQFVETQRQEMEKHLADWQEIHDSMADEISRQTFIDVLRYRLTADPCYMRGYKVRIEEQYLESFMNYREEVFVDAGGFDGDTSEAFAKYCSDYKRIIFFEPSSKNMLAARKRLQNHQGIEYHSIGLSDAKGTLQFNQDAGSASSVTGAGGEIIAVDTLDSLVKEPVSFIKMDLEGWEMNALGGARNHIKSSKPKLAIAAYHKSTDFRLIYRFIKQFDHNYRIYMRHYTQGWSETVLYFTH